MENNVIFNLKQTIGIGDSKGARIKISNDFETKEVINTNGRIVSVVLKNNTQIERFEAKFENGEMVIEKRGLSKGKQVEEKQELKKQWNAGELGYITFLAHNLFDADKSITIKAGEKIYFGDTDVYITSDDGVHLKFKDENNQSITLTDIANRTGANNKVSISDNDESGFLNQKLGKGFKFGNKVDVDFSKIDFSNYEITDLEDNNLNIVVYDTESKIKKRLPLSLLLERFGTIEEILPLKNEVKLVKEFEYINSSSGATHVTRDHNLGISNEDFSLGRYVVLKQNSSSYWQSIRLLLYHQDTSSGASDYVTNNKVVFRCESNSTTKVKIFKFW